MNPTKNQLTRRSVLAAAALTPLAAVELASQATAAPFVSPDENYKVKHGNINQSVCGWCYNKTHNAEQLATLAASLGMKSVELVPAKEWPMLKKLGLVCAITSSHGFKNGPSSKENHEFVLKTLTERIDETSEAGFPNVITFSGMRTDAKGVTIPDDVGLENTVACMKKIIGHAEKKKVNLCIEMLNTRDSSHPMKGHPGYMGDSLAWCKEVCDRVGSERMKILFDIYHVQIMHGDVIRHIKEYAKYIAHIHTAGNPGRCELDDTQELYYPPIMKALIDIKYTGYVGHEFIPTREPNQGLREAVALCNV